MDGRRGGGRGRVLEEELEDTLSAAIRDGNQFTAQGGDLVVAVFGFMIVVVVVAVVVGVVAVVVVVATAVVAVVYSSVEHSTTGGRWGRGGRGEGGVVWRRRWQTCCIQPSMTFTTLWSRKMTRGLYDGGRRPSSDDSFHSPTVTPPSALDKPSIMKS